MKNISLGLLYAMLWSSGSIALKIGLSISQPFVITNVRYLAGSALTLFIVLVIQKTPLPQKHEWSALIICSILTMVGYSTFFVFALKDVTAGIATLGVATGPLLINALNAIWMKQAIKWNIWLALLVGIVGINIAIYPLLRNAHSTLNGLLLLVASILCYTVGTVYYQRINWSLSKMSINGWQMLFATICYLPLSYFFYEKDLNHYNFTFALSVFWLIVPVSIVAVQIWLYLLKSEPSRATLWLYVCPVFGFYYSNLFTGEPITIHTILGTILVIVTLLIGQRK